jgi:hypothetical protein
MLDNTLRETIPFSKNSIFWDITPCSPSKVSQRFGGKVACIFRVEEEAKQETRSNKAGHQACPLRAPINPEPFPGFALFFPNRFPTGSASYLFHADFLLCLLLDSEDGGDMVFRNVGCFSTNYTALYPR